MIFAIKDKLKILDRNRMIYIKKCSGSGVFNLTKVLPIEATIEDGNDFITVVDLV